MKSGILIITLFISQLAFTQNWTGAVNSDWNNSGNWSTWPLNGEDLTINPANYSGASASPIINVNSVFSPALITITNGGNLTINANLTTIDDVECIGVGSSITVNSGTFSVNPGDGGRLIFDLGATGIINGGNVVVDERFIAGENALVTINGGNASSGERLLMDLGGQFVQEGGNVSVAAVFAMADGSATLNSGYTLNNGNLNITGEFAIECEAGNFQPFFIQNNGTLTVNGDMFWFGSLPGTGRGFFIQNGGTANVNGIIQNMLASTTGMHFEVNNNAVFTTTGTTFESLHATDSLKLTGNAQFNISQTNFSLINNGVIFGESGEFNIDGNCNATGTGFFQYPNLNILTASTLTHTSASDFHIFNDLTLNGNYTHLNHELVFNGNGLQNINGASNLTAYDLTISNSSNGVALNTDVFVNGYLNLVDGIVSSSAVNSIELSATATSSPGNDSSFVAGPMLKTGNTGFIFPVGKNGKWARIGISSPTNITDTYMAEYFNNAFSSITPVNSPLTAVSSIEHWNLEHLNGNTPLQVELFWENASTSAITDCNELSIANWNGSAWVNELAVASGNCTGTNSGAIQTNAVTSGLGNFTFGFYSGVTSQQFDVCAGTSITVGPNTYNSTGTYIDILQDVNNNDSIVITALNVTTPNAAINLTVPSLTAVDMNADTYDWLDCYSNNSTGNTNALFTPTQSGWYALAVSTNGCADTSACLYFTLIDTTICQGESILIGNSTYDSLGLYHNLLTATNNQDSIVQLALSINQVDTSIWMTPLSLESSNTNATSFQWFDCTNNTIIPNETNNSFLFYANGSYALIVEENGCVDTSDCRTIFDVGLPVNNMELITFYPNPATSSLQFNGTSAGMIVEIHSMMGQIVLTERLNKSGKIELPLESGNYIVTVLSNGDIVSRQKLVIQ